MNKRKVGNDYENRACEYLEANGYTIIEKNFRCYKGEIDIIARDNSFLVFVEVKYRSKNSFGYSAEAVNIHKQNIIYKVAQCYLSLHKEYMEAPCRFDVIAFDSHELTHIKNAFGGL